MRKNAQGQYTANVGKPFEVELAAGNDLSWNLIGRRGHVIDRKSTSRESQAWLGIDSSNGVLSGTPTAPGYNVVIVVARRGKGDDALVDARRVVVVVE